MELPGRAGVGRGVHGDAPPGRRSGRVGRVSGRAGNEVADRDAVGAEPVSERPGLDLAGGEGEFGDDVGLGARARRGRVLGDDAGVVGGGAKPVEKTRSRWVAPGEPAPVARPRRQ